MEIEGVRWKCTFNREWKILKIKGCGYERKENVNCYPFNMWVIISPTKSSKFDLKRNYLNPYRR